MKSNVFALLVLVFLFSNCKKEDPPPTSNNTGSNIVYYPVGSWSFSVVFNGVTYEAAGVDEYPLFMTNGGNIVYSSHGSSGLYTVQIKLIDKSDASYVSGEIMSMNIVFNNLSAGTTMAQIQPAMGAYYDYIQDSIGSLSMGLYPMAQGGAFTQAEYTDYNIPFTVVDLGTPSHYLSTPYVLGENLVGNYTGTIYFSDGTTDVQNGEVNYVYNVPMPISISFSAMRYD